MRLDQTKFVDYVSEKLQSVVNDAIRDLKNDDDDACVVIWSNRPFVCASTEGQAIGGESQKLGLYINLFEDDSDARFVPLDEIARMEIARASKSEIEETVAIWRKFAEVIEAAGKAKMQTDEKSGGF
jgi:hypothetical protein